MFIRSRFLENAMYQQIPILCAFPIIGARTRQTNDFPRSTLNADDWIAWFEANNQTTRSPNTKRERPRETSTGKINSSLSPHSE